MATPTETADGVRRAVDGDNNGDAGAQGTPALAVDTIQDGLLEVQVQQPAEGQAADMMATPDQPRQALEALSGAEVYQPAVCYDTPDQQTGGPTIRVDTSNAPAPPASLMPAAPALRPPAVDANGATAGNRYAAGIGPSLPLMNFQVVPLPAAPVSMAAQPQVLLVTARLADLRLNANVGNPAPT